VLFSFAFLGLAIFIRCFVNVFDYIMLMVYMYTRKDQFIDAN